MVASKYAKKSTLINIINDMLCHAAFTNVLLTTSCKQLAYYKNVLWSGMVWLICLIVSLLAICLTLLVTCVHADYHVFKLL